METKSYLKQKETNKVHGCKNFENIEQNFAKKIIEIRLKIKLRGNINKSMIN